MTIIQFLQKHEKLNGVILIRILASAPGRKFYILELANLLYNAKYPGRAANPAQHYLARIPIPMTDTEAIRQYRRRIACLKAQLRAAQNEPDPVAGGCRSRGPRLRGYLIPVAGGCRSSAQGVVTSPSPQKPEASTADGFAASVDREVDSPNAELRQAPATGTAELRQAPATAEVAGGCQSSAQGVVTSPSPQRPEASTAAGFAASVDREVDSPNAELWQAPATGQAPATDKTGTTSTAGKPPPRSFPESNQLSRDRICPVRNVCRLQCGKTYAAGMCQPLVKCIVSLM